MSAHTHLHAEDDSRWCMLPSRPLVDNRDLGNQVHEILLHVAIDGIAPIPRTTVHTCQPNHSQAGVAHFALNCICCHIRYDPTDRLI
jgi:hypothetical protein